MSLRALLMGSIAALSLDISAHASTFAFENNNGATLPLSIKSDGVTATFTSVAGNGYTVGNTNGFFSFNTALEDLNGFASNPLNISFSSPISGTIVIPFGFQDAFGTTLDYLTLVANTGQTFTVLAEPNSFVLAEPEGVAQFSLNAPITSLTLTGSNLDAPLAIGDISTATTPEPTSIVLLATGLAGMAFRRFRRS